MRRAKLIFVGHGGGGKTALVRRLREGTFDVHTATDGVEMAEWSEDTFGPAITYSILDCGTIYSRAVPVQRARITKARYLILYSTSRCRGFRR